MAKFPLVKIKVASGKHDIFSQFFYRAMTFIQSRAGLET